MDRMAAATRPTGNGTGRPQGPTRGTERRDKKRAGHAEQQMDECKRQLQDWSNKCLSK